MIRFIASRQNLNIKCTKTDYAALKPATDSRPNPATEIKGNIGSYDEEILDTKANKPLTM